MATIQKARAIIDLVDVKVMEAAEEAALVNSNECKAGIIFDALVSVSVASLQTF